MDARSLRNLAGVHPNLVKVILRAEALCPQLFIVIEGLREKSRQAELYAQGRTTPGKIVTNTMESKHLPQKDGFGHAADIAPAPISWACTPENLVRFDVVANAMFIASEELEIPIRWGADWDMDGNRREKRESDNPHFELVM